MNLPFRHLKTVKCFENTAWSADYKGSMSSLLGFFQGLIGVYLVNYSSFIFQELLASQTSSHPVIYSKYSHIKVPSSHLRPNPRPKYTLSSPWVLKAKTFFILSHPSFENGLSTSGASVVPPMSKMSKQSISLAMKEKQDHILLKNMSFPNSGRAA